MLAKSQYNACNLLLVNRMQFTRASCKPLGLSAVHASNGEFAEGCTHKDAQALTMHKELP